jgi:DNA-binding PadR family transcriptional regulator
VEHITPDWSNVNAVTSRPTSTSFAVLGLLAIQPWTAYDLVAQSRRSLHWFWPRSEAHLYAELKRIVARGHAEAAVVEGRRERSQRTLYTITTEGRTALADWLRTEPAPATLEVEGMLRVLLADQGSKNDLRAALEATALQVRATRDAGIPLIEDLLATGGHFPHRGHLTERLVAFYDEFNRLLDRWCAETLAEMETWPDTRDVGLTADARKRLERIIDTPVSETTMPRPGRSASG